MRVHFLESYIRINQLYVTKTYPRFKALQTYTWPHYKTLKQLFSNLPHIRINWKTFKFFGHRVQASVKKKKKTSAGTIKVENHCPKFKKCNFYVSEVKNHCIDTDLFLHLISKL